MYYCCKGCSNCCSKCGKCCDDCCSSCCSCCSSCCDEIIKCISQCFSKPFSFCTFLAFFITFLPTVFMIVAIAKGSSYDCKESMTKTALIVQGINNLVNFLFCIYIVCSFAEKYKEKNKHGSEEKNICQRTVNMIMYDFVVCFYVIALIFFIVWVSMGHTAYNNEPQNSACFKENDGFLMKILLFNLISMDIFLIAGSIMFVLCLIIAACDEGSCTFYDICRCLTLCCTCGCWDIGKREQKTNKNYNPNRVEYAHQNRSLYPESRNNWLDKSKKLLSGFGFGLFGDSKSQQQQQPQHVMPPPQMQMQTNQNQQQNLNTHNNLQPQNPYLTNQQQQQPMNMYPNQQAQPHNQYPQQYQYPPAPMYPMQNQMMAVPQAPPPAANHDPLNNSQMPMMQYGHNANPQQMAYNPHANQNPYGMNQQEPKKEKGLLEKAKDAAKDVKDKLFK